ncbi:MarR family winged helix-turn-helix transcriptional regulator [Fusobacterium necrophorum]|nr:MarR family transcriptional regulator [Fusobacterium necrophorum]
MKENMGKKYTKIYYEHSSLYEAYARKHGLHSKSLFILMWIYYNPQGITQHRICEKTFSTKQVVGTTIKIYLEKEYIFLEKSNKDGRSKLIKLTEKGRKYAIDILEPLVMIEEKAMLALTIEEQERLLELSEKFYQQFRLCLEEIRKEEYDTI